MTGLVTPSWRPIHLSYDTVYIPVQGEKFLNLDDFVRTTMAIYHCLIYRRRVYSEIFHYSNHSDVKTGQFSFKS